MSDQEVYERRFDGRMNQKQIWAAKSISRRIKCLFYSWKIPASKGGWEEYSTYSIWGEEASRQGDACDGKVPRGDAVQQHGAASTESTCLPPCPGLLFSSCHSATSWGNTGLTWHFFSLFCFVIEQNKWKFGQNSVFQTRATFIDLLLKFRSDLSGNFVGMISFCLVTSSPSRAVRGWLSEQFVPERGWAWPFLPMCCWHGTRTLVSPCSFLLKHPSPGTQKHPYHVVDVY